MAQLRRAGEDGRQAAQDQVVAELATATDLEDVTPEPDGEARRYRRDAVILRLKGRRRRRPPRP